MRLNLHFLAVILLFSVTSIAQIDSATYVLGDVSTEFNNNVQLASETFGCGDTLTVNIGTGRYVTGIDVYYSMEADSLANAWVSEQRSYLEFVNTNTKENAIAAGDPNWDSAGVLSYNRTNLNIANGLQATGQLQFFLHAFRTFGNNPFCGTNFQNIVDSTWKIVVHHIPAPTCPAPTALASATYTTNSIDLNWTTGGATNWQVGYRIAGSTGAYTLAATTTNPFTLTGLTAGMQYEIGVRDSCGLADVSFWTGSIQAQTACNPIAAPWLENFDGAGWTSGTGAGNVGNAINLCWSRPNGNPNFGTRTGPTTSGASGPSADFSGTGNYIYTEASNGATGAGEIISPSVIVSGSIAKPQLRFRSHLYGNNITSLEVQVDNGSGFGASLLSIAGQQQTGNADAWSEDTLGLSAFSGDTIRIKFIGTNAGFNGDISIDEVEIREAPTCFEPDTLWANSASSTGIDLGWLTGGASNWQIGYRVSGSTGAFTLVSANSNPFSLSGLSPATIYEIVVKDSCGTGNSSVWSLPITVGTLCNPAVAPWSENFDGTNWTSGAGAANAGNLIDYCWSRPDGNPPNFGVRTAGTNSGATGPSTDVSGTGNYLYTEASNGLGTGEVSTAWVVVSSSIVNPTLEFSYHMFGNNITDLQIQVDNGTGFGTTLKTISGAQQTASTDAWKKDTLDLTAFSGDTIRIKFLGTNTGFNGDIAIDEISIDVPPPCVDPQNLTLDFAWINTASVAWTTGGAANWQLEFGTTGFVVGAGTRVGVSTNPAIFNGLLPATTYDVYVRDSCGVGVTSAWVGPLTFTTLCAPYATPFSENFDSTTIWTTGANNVALGTIDNCWNRYPTNQFAWKTGPAPQQSTFAGTGVDHTTGTGQFIYSERVANPVNGIVEAFMETPPVYINGLTNPQLTFWYHMYGNSLVGLEVEINTGSGWTNIYTRNGQQQTSGTDPWKEAVVNLSSYNGDTVVVRFMSTINNGGTNNDVSIDDVSIDDAPSCPKPQDLAVIGNTNNTVTLGWTSGGATTWNIEYGTPGFTVGTGTYVTATSNPFTISGLIANTPYEFYVRDSCGVADVSPWVGSDSATTDCNPVAAPLVANFDGTGWTLGVGGNPGNLDACWRRFPEDSYVFEPGTNGTPTNGTGPLGDNTSGTGKYLYSETYFNFGAFNPNEASVVSPLVDVSGLINPELVFFYHFFGNEINTVEVNVFDGSAWTNVRTYTGQQQLASGDAWKEERIDLLAFANDTIKVEIKAIKQLGNTTLADMAIDDFSIAEMPLCPKPDSLMTSNATTTSIDLNWISGGASNWVIEYGPVGFAPGTGSKVYVNTNPYTVSGLNPSTTYDFYVQDSCGVAVLSDSIGPVYGTTVCATISAPYFEHFDGPTFSPGPQGFGVTGFMDTCWSRFPYGTYFWKPGPSLPQTNGTGSTIGDHTTGNGGYVFTESGGFVGPPLSAWLLSPPISLSPLTTPEMSYWYHMFGPNVNDLYVEISNNGGTSFTAVDTLSGNQQTSQADAWKEAVIDISTYANDTILVRFRAEKTSNGNQSDISIDDLSIHEAPSCPKPNNLVSTGAASNSITLSWTSGGASNWNIEYGPVGFTQGNGTIVNAASNPFTVTGLAPKTGYCFYVRDSCAVGDVSEWSLEACDTTDCGVFTAPWSEGFDGADWQTGAGAQNANHQVSSCWSRPSNANPNFSTRSGGTGSNNTGPSADVSGTGNYLFTEASGGAQGTGEITSPQIFIPLTIGNPRITFAYHMFGTGIDSLEVRVSVNGGAFSRIGGLVGAQQSASTDAWLHEDISISGNSGDTIQIRFLGTNNAFAGDIAIDSVVVEQAPNCPNPQQLLVTNVTATTATLGWITGGATNWQIEYGPVGFTNGTGTIVAAATNPFTITGLSPQTGYDFYVRDSCGVADVSIWSGLASDTTRCGVTAAPYFENFDGNTFVVGGAFGNPGSIDACWERTFATSYFWAVEQNGTVSANTGPSNDHTTGAGKFMFTDGNQTAQNTELISPDVDLAPLTNPQLRFWYHMYGNSIDKLEVDVWDGTAWNNVWIQNGQQHNASNDPWTEAVVSLSAFTGDTVRVRMNGFRAGFQTSNDMAIDDFWIGDSTSCARPDSLLLVSATQTSLTLSWNSTSGLGSVLKYRPAGSASPFSFASVLGSSTTLNGLTPSTTYEIFVRDSCGATDVSLYTSGELFSTLCGVVVAPYSESFNGAGWVPGNGNTNVGDEIHTCWIRPTNTGVRFTTGTGTTPSNGTGPTGDATGGGQYLYTEASIGAGTSEIESPMIVVSSFLANPVLEFSYHMFGNAITSLAVEIDNGSGYQNVKTITGQQQTANAAPWLSDTVDLTSYLGDTIQVKFIGINTAFGGDIAIDEVSVDGQVVNCSPPSNIGITGITSTAAQVSWTSNSNNSILEVVPVGQAQGTGLFFRGVTSPYNVGPLLPNTNYRVYIADSCGTTRSTWIDTTFMTTNCLPLAGGISFSNATASSVTLTWNSNSNVSEIEAVPFGQAQGTGILYTPVVSPHVAGGLSTKTLYTFYVRDLCGSNSSSWISDTASTTSCPAVVAVFTGTPNLLTIGFSRSGTTGADTLSWDFGDGNSTIGNNPSHTYGAAGTYKVTLTATNACGNWDTTSAYFTICDSLIADFTFTGSNKQYTFDASGSVGATSYRWDFASQHDTTGVNVVYEFPTVGTKPVTLWVYNSCGDSTSVTKNVTVCLAPIADWTYNVVSTTSQGMLVQFDGTASQNAVNYDWDFGDGNTSTGSATPQNLYLTPGLFYTVRLTVTNSCGDKNSKTFRLDQIGLEELELANYFKLYPSPASKVVNISWSLPNVQIQKLEVRDVSGRLLLVKDNFAEQDLEVQLNVENLAQGFYSIKVFSNKGVITKEFIRE